MKQQDDGGHPVNSTVNRVRHVSSSSFVVPCGVIRMGDSRESDKIKNVRVKETVGNKL